jgi:hypothetical protein
MMHSDWRLGKGLHMVALGELALRQKTSNALC